MTTQAREAAAELVAAIRDRALAEVHEHAREAGDQYRDAELYRQRALARWHDTRAQQRQRCAELIHSTTRRAA